VRSERAIIASIARAFRATGRGAPGVFAGMGDDAAILRLGQSLWAVSTDACVEGAHFLSGLHAPEDSGYKALARSVSDLAAVGATPRYFLMNLAVPPARTGAWLRRFTAGMARAARFLDMHLIGGDTTAAPQHAPVSANLCVLGEIQGGRPVLRCGARPGDILFLSGVAGAAQLGLELVRRNLHRRARYRNLLRRHLHPEPRIALGQWLAQHKLATAMIDTSDGLSTDLFNLCSAGRVGAEIDLARLTKPRVPAELLRKKFSPEEMALHGGDDYELLFAVRAEYSARIPARFKGVPLTTIGRITAGSVIRVREGGKLRTLLPRGWDPFR
jgi:thiamine-monophosphate kinase